MRNQLLLFLPKPLSSFQDFYIQNGSLPVLEDDGELILGKFMLFTSIDFLKVLFEGT